MSKKPGNWNKRQATKEHIDIDYYASLSPDEKKFMDKFVREFYHACFSKDGNDLHDNKEAKRKIYGANNARNRDMFNKWDRAPGMLGENLTYSDPETADDDEDAE